MKKIVKKKRRVLVQTTGGIRFELKTETIEQVHDAEGHKAFRSEIAKAFSGRRVISGTRKGKYFATKGYTLDHPVRRYYDLNFIDIGCMTFADKNYQRLKKWALS
jgi:hypothetical protein